MASTNSVSVYQLKISLKNFKNPTVYRRVHMLSNSTFKELHRVIISVMNWTNDHMHIFRKPRPRGVPYSEKDELEIGGVSKDKNGKERPYMEYYGIRKLNEKIAKLTDYFKAPKDLIGYDYDGWDHVISLERILPFVPGKEYPVCVAGRRGHPPEHPPEDYDFEFDDEWMTEVFDPKSVKFLKSTETEDEEINDWIIF